MIKEGKIGVQEAVSLIAITISVKVYFTSPAFVAKATGTASWYMTLISASTAILGFALMILLLKRFPGKGLIQIFELSLGRIIGSVFSLILFTFLVAISAVLVREFGEVMKVYVLPLTPPSFIIGVFLFMTAVACFMGLESIARVSRLLAYYILAGFILVIIFASPHYDVHNLFPILGYGLDKTVVVGLARSSFYGEVIVLGIIATSMQGISHVKKAGYLALIISGLATATSLITTMMAFNYSTAQETTSRMYELTRLIHIGGFLQRLDPLFLFTWCIGTLISVTLIFYCTLSTYCKTFRIQDMRPIIIPAAIVLFTLSMIPQDLATIASYVHVTRQYGWIVFYGMPFIALLTEIVRKKKGTRSTNQPRMRNK